jgi:hypothetical protein
MCCMIFSPPPPPQPPRPFIIQSIISHCYFRWGPLHCGQPTSRTCEKGLWLQQSRNKDMKWKVKKVGLGTCNTLMMLKRFCIASFCLILNRLTRKKFVREKAIKDDIYQRIHSRAWSCCWCGRERAWTDGRKNRFGKREWKGIGKWNDKRDWKKAIVRDWKKKWEGIGEVDTKKGVKRGNWKVLERRNEKGLQRWTKGMEKVLALIGLAEAR